MDRPAGLVDRRVWRCAFLAWMVSIAGVYALTLRPSIAWNDAPEFVDVSYTLGVSHPPGSPTYTLLGKLATLIPLGGIAARVNLLSALCGMTALVLLVLSISGWHERRGGNLAAGRAAGLLAGSLLGLSPTFWRFATSAEVYAPFVLTIALLLFLGQRWEDTGDEQYLLLGGLLYGLSGGVHGTSIFFAPALAVFMLTGVSRGQLPRTALRVLVVGILGASVFLYLPLRAGTEPAINWGHPDTWARFWNLVSDRKDTAYHFPLDSKPWWPYIQVFGGNLRDQLSLVGSMAAVGGLVLLWARSPRLAAFTFLMAAGNVVFFILNWTIPDAYLPTYYLAAFWCGLLLAAVLDAAGRWRTAVPVAGCALMLFAIVGHARVGGTQMGLQANDEARSSTENLLFHLPQDSLVIVTAAWFPMRYLQDVEALRPDLTVLLVSDVARPEYFSPVTAWRYPKLRIPSRFHGKEEWERFFEELLRENLPQVPVYWEPHDLLDKHVAVYLSPWRYLWRLNSTEKPTLSHSEVQAYFADLNEYLAQEIHVAPGPQGSGGPLIVQDPESLKYHSYLLAGSGRLLKRKGDPQDALVLMELAHALTPNDATVLNELGGLYSGFERWSDAERMFEQAVHLAPQNPIPLVNLAVLQINRGRFTAGRRSLDRALALNPRSPEAYHELSVLEQSQGRLGPARHALELAIEYAIDEKLKATWRSELGGLDKTARR